MTNSGSQNTRTQEAANTPRRDPRSKTAHCSGSPRFADSALNAVAKRDGLAAAWTAAFSSLGPDAPKAVQGDFAVGIRLPDGSVFLAVDRFAVRTICYRQQGDLIEFSERADDLAKSASDLDPQAIFDYLYHHFIASPRTIFRDVFRLPPGHCAHFRDGRLSIAPYWQPGFEEPSNQRFEPLRDEFRQCLRDAVSSQLDSARVGCFLSGGTDSSTVAGLLGEVTGTPAQTFSIGFDAAGYDEMEYSRIAARHFGAEHHEYYVTPSDLINSIPMVAGSYDQPFGNSSVLPAYYCAKVAREAGIDKILGGDGGDELFGGNTRYAKQRVFGLYGSIPAGVRNHLLQPLLIGNPLAPRVPLVRKASSYVSQAMVPMPDRMQSYNLIMRLGLSDVLCAGFLDAVDVDGPINHQREVYDQCTASSLVNRMLAFDWRYTLAENDLPKVVGATALAHLPVGFPLLDDRLVDFSMRLPAHFKVKGLKLRWFFKEALRGFLPDQIITKKKQGFGLPFGVWTVRNPDLFRLAEDSLRSLGTRGIMRPDFIDALLTRHIHAHPGYYGELVWISMMLEQWLRKNAPDYRMP